MPFDSAFLEVVNLEGDYSNHKDDSGGKTRFGITEELARSYDYQGEMQFLPISTAKLIYQEAFWHPLNLTAIDLLSANIALEVFDTAVNTGTRRAAMFLQRALNVLNKRQDYYADITVDGSIGAKTVSALRACLQLPNRERSLFKMLNALQGAFYIELAESREKDESFILGWFINRVD